MGSTLNREAIISAVYAAIDEVNMTLPKDRHIAKSPETRLSGADSGLESLSMVNLIVETEQQIEMACGQMIDIANQQAASREDNPFRTVDTLADYIGILLEDEQNG